MSYLFFLKTFNDTDHIAPLIWHLLNKGNHVHLFCIGDVVPDKDPRLLFLATFPNLSVYDARSRPLKKWHKWRKSLYNTWLFWVVFFYSKKIKCVASEWFRPEYGILRGKAFGLARKLGIATIALPHGYNVFLNDEVSTSLINSEGARPWADRNKFDFYCNCTERQVEHMVRMGIAPEIARTIGCSRFSKAWHEVFISSIENEAIARAEKLFDKSQINVVFMTPHWAYNADKVVGLELIKSISRIPGVNLVVKPHTRKGSGDVNADEVGEDVVISGESSSALIYHCDVCIVCASSILFEVLLQKKIAINPQFIHRNQTIFDDYDGAESFNELNDLVQFVEDLVQQKGRLGASRDHSAFLEMYLHDGADITPFDMFDRVLSEVDA